MTEQQKELIGFLSEKLTNTKGCGICHSINFRIDTGQDDYRTVCTQCGSTQLFNKHVVDCRIKKEEIV